MSIDFTELERRLGYHFADQDKLRVALTHRSFVNESGGATPDNERMEFLGDAVIGLAVAALLYEQNATLNEGQLTQRRAEVVSATGLAAVAEALEIGNFLRLGRGEERGGGRKNNRLLASALEACLGAIYEDAGANVAIDVAKRVLAIAVANAKEGSSDYKSKLQQWTQAKRGARPDYKVERSEGPDHARIFYVSVAVAGEALAQGSGPSKVEAEQQAARAALDSLGVL